MSNYEGVSKIHKITKNSELKQDPKTKLIEMINQDINHEQEILMNSPGLPIYNHAKSEGKMEILQRMLHYIEQVL